MQKTITSYLPIRLRASLDKKAIDYGLLVNNGEYKKMKNSDIINTAINFFLYETQNKSEDEIKEIIETTAKKYNLFK